MLSIIDRQVHRIDVPHHVRYRVVLLNVLSFASLAYIANRKGHYVMAASGAWRFWRGRRRADLRNLALMRIIGSDDTPIAPPCIGSPN